LQHKKGHDKDGRFLIFLRPNGASAAACNNDSQRKARYLFIHKIGAVMKRASSAEVHSAKEKTQTANRAANYSDDPHEAGTSCARQQLAYLVPE